MSKYKQSAALIIQLIMVNAILLTHQVQPPLLSLVTSPPFAREFLHLPGQKFFNFADIRDEIVRETDRLTGSNKGISAKSINLRIYSPFVLNLTMVDLPGITKVKKKRRLVPWAN